VLREASVTDRRWETFGVRSPDLPREHHPPYKHAAHSPAEVSAPDTDREHRRPELACGERPRSLPTEQATLKCVYLAIMSLGPTAEGRRHWSNRWKAALNAGFRYPDRHHPRHRPASEVARLESERMRTLGRRPFSPGQQSYLNYFFGDGFCWGFGLGLSWACSPIMSMSSPSSSSTAPL